MYTMGDISHQRQRWGRMFSNALDLDSWGQVHNHTVYVDDGGLLQLSPRLWYSPTVMFLHIGRRSYWRISTTIASLGRGMFEDT